MSGFWVVVGPNLGHVFKLSLWQDGKAVREGACSMLFGDLSEYQALLQQWLTELGLVRSQVRIMMHPGDWDQGEHDWLLPDALAVLRLVGL